MTDRREALRWMALVMASAGLSGVFASAARGEMRARNLGYGRDPNLRVPSEGPWPRVLTGAQRTVAVAILDVILPGTAGAPPASAIGLVDFLDEWISAPYPQQKADAELLVPLLDEFERAQRAGTAVSQSAAAIENTPAFRRLCVVSAAAYYTSPAGISAIGFLGNQPRPSFEGPPDPVLLHFEQECKNL